MKNKVAGPKAAKAAVARSKGEKWNSLKRRLLEAQRIARGLAVAAAKASGEAKQAQALSDIENHAARQALTLKTTGLAEWEAQFLKAQEAWERHCSIARKARFAEYEASRAKWKAKLAWLDYVAKEAPQTFAAWKAQEGRLP